jgi:hypothetical protein
MTLHRCLAALGLAACLGLLAPAPASASIFGDAGRLVKKTTKKVGHAAGGVVKDVGRATGKAAKATGKAASSVGKAAARTTGAVAKTAVKTGGKVAKGIGSVAVGAAKAVEPLGVAVGKPFVSTPATPRVYTSVDRGMYGPGWKEPPRPTQPDYRQHSSPFMQNKR